MNKEIQLLFNKQWKIIESIRNPNWYVLPGFAKNSKKKKPRGKTAKQCSKLMWFISS